MLWGRRAWLQIRIARCMPWCFLLASLWSNVAFSVSTNSLLLTRMTHEKAVQHGWCEYPVNHDWRAVPALVNMFVWMNASHQHIGTTNHKVLFFLRMRRQMVTFWAKYDTGCSYPMRLVAVRRYSQSLLIWSQACLPHSMMGDGWRG